jgi:hypothetical protein
VKAETESLDRAQDMFSGVSLQSGQFCESQNQDGAPKNIGRWWWEDMERGRQKNGLILASQVSQAPGEDCPKCL